jgi:hypothetical protein
VRLRTVGARSANAAIDLQFLPDDGVRPSNRRLSCETPPVEGSRILPRPLRSPRSGAILGPMISLGSKAPEFALSDHLGRTISSADFVGKRHLLLLFYPLDFTPT